MLYGVRYLHILQFSKHYKMRRLRSASNSCVKTESVDNVMSKHCHTLQTELEVQNLRKSLLVWYDKNKRELQWRDLAKHSDVNIRAYSGRQVFTCCIWHCL